MPSWGRMGEVVGGIFGGFFFEGGWELFWEINVCIC